MKKSNWVQTGLGITVVLACSSSVWAGFNDGFESGLGAWTTNGTVQTVTSEAPRDSTLSGNWLPTEGTHFASVWSPFPHSQLYREFNGLAGETLQFDYYFDLNDKEHSGDNAFAMIQLPDTSWLYSLYLNATTPGWQSFSYTLPADGTYLLLFRATVADANPTNVFESVLGIDNVRVGPQATDSTWLGGYDAALDTRPEKQGWTVTNNPPDTQPLIQNNVFYSSSTERQYLYWNRIDNYICFPVSQGLVVEFELKINSSPYVPISSDRWRTGYSVWVSDYQGRMFLIGIADTGVILSNHPDWLNTNSSSFVPFNTTNGFHRYRFVIQNNTGHLQIDGNQVVSLGAGAVNSTIPNGVVFGDGTMFASHDAELTYLRYGVITKPGDTDDDGTVDIHDLEGIAGHWLAGNCGCMSCCEGADINHSGKVDLEDLAILSLGWLG